MSAKFCILIADELLYSALYCTRLCEVCYVMSTANLIYCLTGSKKKVREESPVNKAEAKLIQEIKDGWPGAAWSTNNPPSQVVSFFFFLSFFLSFFLAFFLSFFLSHSSISPGSLLRPRKRKVGNKENMRNYQASLPDSWVIGGIIIKV